LLLVHLPSGGTNVDCDDALRSVGSQSPERLGGRRRRCAEALEVKLTIAVVPSSKEEVTEPGYDGRLSPLAPRGTY
jgi:hypothetical protein